MKLQQSTTISKYFGELKDPRIERSKLHKLIDIVTITICAVISGADSWVDIELYGKTKWKWLKKFLELANGIPSHDTNATSLRSFRPSAVTAMFFEMDKSN